MVQKQNVYYIYKYENLIQKKEKIRKLLFFCTNYINDKVN